MPGKQSNGSDLGYEITDARLVSADLTVVDYDFSEIVLNGQDAHLNINDPNHDVAIIFTLSYLAQSHHKHRRACQCVLHDNTIYKVCCTHSSTRYTIAHDMEFTSDIAIIQPLVTEAI